jgi:ABC-type phosphate/phosphonate transport system substrate-binding protein
MLTQNLTFLMNKNLGFPATEEPWKGILSAEGFTADVTTDVTKMNQALEEGDPDVAYVTGAGYCVMMRNGNQHYRGLVIATSKFTGQPAQCSLLVVRQDDPAKSLDDLEGSEYGYINRSCSSSFFPPAILLNQKGKKLDTFFKLKQVPGWQERVDAVVAKSIRATMILEDVWKMTPSNKKHLKIIGEYSRCVPAILIVRKGLASVVVKDLQEHLLSYVPNWTNVYGAFRPYYFADVQTFYHQVGLLPEDEIKAS